MIYRRPIHHTTCIPGILHRAPIHSKYFYDASCDGGDYFSISCNLSNKLGLYFHVTGVFIPNTVLISYSSSRNNLGGHLQFSWRSSSSRGYRVYISELLFLLAGGRGCRLWRRRSCRATFHDVECEASGVIIIRLESTSTRLSRDFIRFSWFSPHCALSWLSHDSRYHGATGM